MSQDLTAHYNELLSENEPFIYNGPNNIFKLGHQRISYWKSVNVYSGSFNPLHDGHRFIFSCAKTYEMTTSFSTCYEISINRIGKDHIKLEELSKRLSQFSDKDFVLVTNSPRFLSKIADIRRFLDVKPTFHIGHDTALRLIEDVGVSGLGGLDARFMVYNRLVNGKMNLDQTIFDTTRNFYPGVTVPDNLTVISSTQIREKEVVASAV